MIHCEILDTVADHIIAYTGYDKAKYFETNSDRKSCDLKTWLTIIARKMNFSFGEIADYLNMSEDGCFKYFKRHNRRLQDKDYELKWELVKEIAND